MSNKLEPYVWYDPWKLTEEAIKQLQEAEFLNYEARDLEYRVGRNLNAMARAHERDTCCQKQLNENFIDKLALISAFNLNGAPFIVK